MEQLVYESDAYKRYQKFYNYYKRHPIRQIELTEKIIGSKLYWWQKVILIINCVRDGRTKEERRIQRILRRYMVK